MSDLMSWSLVSPGNVADKELQQEREVPALSFRSSCSISIIFNLLSFQDSFAATSLLCKG